MGEIIVLLPNTKPNRTLEEQSGPSTCPSSAYQTNPAAGHQQQCDRPGTLTTDCIRISTKARLSDLRYKQLQRRLVATRIGRALDGSCLIASYLSPIISKALPESYHRFRLCQVVSGCLLTIGVSLPGETADCSDYACFLWPPAHTPSV